MHISNAGICSLTHGMRQFSSNSPLHHMKLSRHLVLLAGAIPAAALPWDGPTATLSSGGNLGRTQDDAPVETDAPPRELIRRDDLSPQLCGWLWGVTPLTLCSPFSTCYFRTDISVVGCCRDTTNLNTCSMYTSCVNSQDITSCSSSCTSDSLILQW